jgi:fumarylacetoacetate (FAA) hydrolase family protein
MTTRSINSIAGDVIAAWGADKIYFGAKPYLLAMLDISSADDKYGQDDARSIVRYFLANARTFKGERAKALKAELKTIIGD